MRVAHIVALVTSCLFVGPVSHACTAFCVYRGGRALVGNNEDFWNPKTKVWFVPAEGERFGRVFFGFDNMYPQGGMNDQGLFFDGFATSRKEVTRSRDKESFPGNLTDEAMATCATVDEVIDLFGRYNLSGLETAMLMFCDKHGGSVIIEGDEFLRKEGDFQVVTNFYQSDTPKGVVPCRRYGIATAMLEASSEASLDLCRRILAATHNEQKAATQYSNIYDLENGVVYLYHFHNFAEEVVIDLKTELAKGPHSMDLPSLFSKSFAFESFKRARERERETVRERRRAKNVDRSGWSEYEGEYTGDQEEAKGRTFTVAIEGDRLIGITHDGERIELIPESRDRFFQVGDFGTVRVTFHRDDKGQVEGLAVLIEELGRRSTAKKVRR